MPRLLILATLLVLALSPSLQGQSGCCSGHGGVCGCRCCDGTALSDRCRPHFPCTGGGSLTPPSRLTASTISSTWIVLTWIDNSSDETSFRIESSTDTEILFHEIGSVEANKTTATIRNLTPSTTYLFRMRAQGTGGVYSPYSGVQTVTTSATSICDAPALCFADGRFKVEATWRRPDGTSGNATVVQFTNDSGYLWFFNSSNIEAVFKILNACRLNNSFWFFAGGLTNVQTEITVTDTLTGARKTYTTPQNTPFKPIQDTAAFATCP